MQPFSYELWRSLWSFIGRSSSKLTVCVHVERGFLCSNTTAVWETDEDISSCTVVSALPLTLKHFWVAGILVTVWNIHVIPCHLDWVSVSGMAVEREGRVKVEQLAVIGVTQLVRVTSLVCSGSSASAARWLGDLAMDYHSFALVNWLKSRLQLEHELTSIPYFDQPGGICCLRLLIEFEPCVYCPGQPGTSL